MGTWKSRLEWLIAVRYGVFVDAPIKGFFGYFDYLKALQEIGLKEETI